MDSRIEKSRNAYERLAFNADGSGLARDLLEESTRLRRELDFRPGVAANLVGLAYIAAAQNRHDDALAAAAEAGLIAEAVGAHAIARQAEEARAHMSRT